MDYIPKIKLRAVEPEDVDFMFECENDPSASKWSDYRAPLSRQQLLEYAVDYDADPFRAEQLRLIVTIQGYKPVGLLDLYAISEKDSRCFIGIMIHESFRRKGFALKALEELKAYNRDVLGLKRFLAKTSVHNEAARSLFLKAGFADLALLPSWHRIGTHFHDFNLLDLQFKNP